MASFEKSISEKLGFQNAAFQGMSKQEVEELIRLRTLREIPKARFAAAVALKVYPVGRGKKTIYSHVDVYRYVENVATEMREVGVRPGSVCAFALPNTIESIVYFLAVQLVNAIALPIDPLLDEETIEVILKTSGAKTFVTLDVDEDERTEDVTFQKLSKVAKAVGIIHWHCYTTRNTGVVLDTHGVRASESAAWHGGSGDYGVDPDTTAAIIVSDAKQPPLLLPLTHRNICSAAKVFTSTYHINQKKCTVFTNPVHSVHGILLLVTTFYAGSSLILVPDGEYNVSNTWDYIAEDRMTYLCVSAEQVLNLAETSTIAAPSDGGSLDFIRVCPGSLDTSTVDLDDLNRTLNTVVLESYGTPESAGLLSANTEYDSKVGTLGKPVSGCEVCVFDPDTRVRLSPNMKGDIAVRGDTVPKAGYMNDDAFNEWAKIPDEDGARRVNSLKLPLSDVEKGDSWFCTGDRGVVDEEGFVIVFGNSWAARKKEEDAKNMAAIPVADEVVEEESREVPESKEVEETPVVGTDEVETYAEVSERTLPSEPAAAMQKEIDEEVPTTSSLTAHVLEESDEEYRGLTSGDNYPKQERLVAMLKEQARRRVKKREEEDMLQAKREADMRSEQMLREKQFMEESESDFRNKINRILTLSAEQQKQDEKSRGAVFSKLKEIVAAQDHLQEQFDLEHKKTMDTLAMRINQLNRELGQMSELNYISKSVAASRQSAPMMVELKMDEADAAAIAAAVSAEEANQNSQRAMERTMGITAMAEEAALRAEEATAKATAAATDCDAATTLVRDTELSAPPVKETIVHEVLAAAPENLNSVERRLRVEMDEVDRAMVSHPSVEKAMAFPVSDHKGGYDIAVAITTRPGAKVTDTWLKLHAQSVLPALAVPNKWYWMRDIPDGTTRDEIAVSEDLIDFEKLKSRPASTKKKTVTAPSFLVKEPLM